MVSPVITPSSTRQLSGLPSQPVKVLPSKSERKPCSSAAGRDPGQHADGQEANCAEPIPCRWLFHNHLLHPMKGLRGVLVEFLEVRLSFSGTRQKVNRPAAVARQLFLAAAGTVILSAAKNLAGTGTSAQIFRCAQNDWPCQDFLPRPRRFPTGRNRVQLGV